MPVNDVSELLQPLLHSIQRQTTDHNDDDYIQRLAIASTGDPIYVNEYLAYIISPHIDIRKHFLIVDSDESPT